MGEATEDRQRAATLPVGDVVRKLLEQHAQIRELFQEVRACVGDERQLVFEELRGLLAVHETAEELIVRPVVRGLLGDAEPAERDSEEAQAAKDLDALSKMDVNDSEFLVKLGALENAVSKHAEAEEKHEFDAIEQQCSSDQRETMGKYLDVALKLAPTRPHPSVAGHEKAVMAVGPIASLIDHTRDAIRDAMR